MLEPDGDTPAVDKLSSDPESVRRLVGGSKNLVALSPATRPGRWRDGDNWTVKNRAWLSARRFKEPEPALRATFAHYQATFAHYQATLDAREVAVGRHRRRAGRLPRPGAFADAVHRLCA